MRAVALGVTDVAFLVSFSGSTREILRLAEIARDRRAHVVALTNYLESPLTQVADAVLLTSVRVDPLGAEVVSPVAMSFVIEVLFTRLLEARPAAAKALAATARVVADRQL